MYVATIIPIARGIPFDNLTYYSPQFLTSGTLVSTPLGKRLIIGVVIESVPLIEAKSIIKNAAFSLKKINSVLSPTSYFQNIIASWKSTSLQTFAPLGTIAELTIPKFLFDYLAEEKTIKNLLNSVPQHNEKIVFSSKVIIGFKKQRLEEYKKIIDETFRNQGSIFVVAPTIADLNFWQRSLSDFYAEILILHSKITKKNFESLLERAANSPKPKIILMTPGYILTPCSNLQTVIVENEGSALYKSRDRYSIDWRIFIKNFGQFSKLQLYWGDVLPRFETLAESKSSPDFLNQSLNNFHVVESNSYINTLAPEVLDLVLDAQAKKYKIFIHSPRKGIAPISRCLDCGQAVSCPNCQLPLVLKKDALATNSPGNYFICTHCDLKLDANLNCKHCHSWNIRPLEIGTIAIKEFLTKSISSENIFAIDEDLTPTDSSIEKIFKKIKEKDFAVIVGTVKALPYLSDISYCLIPFFDRMLSVPSYLTIESLLRLLLNLQEISTKGIVIFTQNPESLLTQQIQKNKLEKIIQTELKERQDLNLPPFGLLIKISITTPAGFQSQTKKKVEEHFKNFDLTFLSAHKVSTDSLKIISTWIIRSSAEELEKENISLNSFLDQLNYPYKIEPNPERF